jgi:hypothetical protein
MRRTALILAVTLLPALGAAPAQAHRGHPGPRITRAEFVAHPLKAGTLERLVVVAHDPDSWISEIQVLWEEESQSGGVIFAHTYCVQDPEFEDPGTRAKLKLDVTFEHPGDYHVEVRAISEKRCEAGNDDRISKTAEMDVTVLDPTETFTDPDDTEGPLDVLEVQQTVVADEAGLGNHVAHTMTMSQPLGPTPLAASGDKIELFFDTDGDPSTIERTILVDVGTDGLLHALVLDSSGTLLGEATVAVDGAELAIDLAADLLGAKVARYEWAVATRSAEGGTCTETAPCSDRAPDAGALLHVL